MKLKPLNTYLGWLCFVIASYVYLSTIESTASLWDCGEFITTGYRLEIGHAPGAPFFLLLTKVFTLLAGNNTSRIAVIANSLSAIVSAATVMFLFWTITHLARKLFPSGNLPVIHTLVIVCSGLIGALSFMFTDTFWFSAVEAEVYATSSLFTAIVFWAILKWENEANKPFANRWIILIAFLMGISVGVHLLNLLVIPAIVFIYYFKNYKPTRKGVLRTFVLAAGILGGINFLIIPGTIKMATWFELFFVNSLKMPYYSGLLLYVVMISAVIIYGIHRTYRNKKIIWNTVLTALAVFLIGYSSYAVIVIRSQADPPMDQNNPENPFSLLSYIKRDQYGSRPLVYGPYFNTEVTGDKPSKKEYIQKNGKYISPIQRYTNRYNNSECAFLPRMWSNQPNHVQGYMRWAKIHPGELFQYATNEFGQMVVYPDGSPVINYQKKQRTPTNIENLRFLLRYQLGHMYFRYFMWNFSGRQNDYQGYFKEDIDKGNWITGIRFLDERRLGNQDKVPSSMQTDKSRNVYYMLPLLLGLIGLFFHYRANQKDFWIVMMLFFFTGLAIVFYLNQPPFEPRERDYAYAGSFYAFAIWIGLSVIALFRASEDIKFSSLFKFLIPAVLINFIIILIDIIANNDITGSLGYIILTLLLFTVLILVRLVRLVFRDEKVVLLLVLIPGITCILLLGIFNWDDHDRSGRTFVRDIASNYLNSCEKNAILFTYADNDTYPLWYAQEVEGIRTDVRVLNLSYLGLHWYIKNLYNKIYDSDPIDLVHKKEDFETGKREQIILDSSNRTSYNLKEAIAFISGENSVIRSQTNINYLPQNKFYIPVNRAEMAESGIIPSQLSKAEDSLKWQLNSQVLDKNNLAVLDILASNFSKRPIYFTYSIPDEFFLNLQTYFEIHGLTYKVVPAQGNNPYTGTGKINTDVMYENMMHKFQWGNIADPGIYIDKNIQRMLSNVRIRYAMLAAQLIEEDKFEKAKEVMDKCLEIMPDRKIPFEADMKLMAGNYFNLGDVEKAFFILDHIIGNTTDKLDYYTSLDKKRMSYFVMELEYYSKSLEDVHKFREELLRILLPEEEI